MSKEQLELPRLYNPDDAKKRSVPRNDKIIKSIIDPNFKLLPKDEEYKKILIQAFAIMSEYPVMSDQVKFIMQISDFNREWCYSVIKDAQHVFGNLSSVNKTYLRNAQRERIIRTIEVLKQRPKPDYALIAKYEELLMKLYDLGKHIDGRDQSTDEKENYEIPSVTFTSDPNALIEDAKIVDEEE